MKKYYLALTNLCNRNCDFCCTYSSPEKRTKLNFAWIENLLSNANDKYEAQLEGGEPLMYPD